MILEFIDKSYLNVEAIFGYPEIVDGKERDTLRIEISISKHNIHEVEEKIRKQNNLLQLASYNKENHNGEGRYVIGDGYTIIESITSSSRDKKDPKKQGRIYKPEIENIIIVLLHQQTLDEWNETLKGLKDSSNTEEVKIWQSLQKSMESLERQPGI